MLEERLSSNAPVVVCRAATWVAGVRKSVVMTSNNYVIKSPSFVIERVRMFSYSVLAKIDFVLIPQTL